MSDFNPEQHGFSVEVIAADHQQKPDVGVTITRDWIDNKGIDAIVDLNNTAIAMAADGVIVDKDKVSLITGAASADLTGKACTTNSIHFAPDTYGDAHSSGTAILKNGGDSWFLIAADYAFGHNLERDITALVKAKGRQGAGQRGVSVPGDDGFLVLPAAGAGERGEGDRAVQHRRGYGELREAGSRVRTGAGQHHGGRLCSGSSRK